jgi:mannose-1-phosphate guanylyltransferase/mannose-6-phosphate isomerase
MIAVIIAGGSGTRLWPLSTHQYPKQLLQVHGDKRSLLQNTYDRAKRLTDTVYVMPESRLLPHIREQLPDLADEHLIVEPGLRGTANCMLAVLAQLSRNHEPDEPIAILWSDHFIRDVDGFVHSYKVAAEAASKHGRVVFIGVEPTYPSIGLGYIQKDGLFDEDNFVYSVDSFTEKPAFDKAQEFTRSGNYLWNSGSFVTTAAAFLQRAQSYASDFYQDYQRLLAAESSDAYREIYLGLKKDAIDYVLWEKLDDALVVPAAFDWLDIGSFKDLHEIMVSDESGNHTKGNTELLEVANSFIENHDDKPLAVIGLDNVVVVNTPHGILVARKDLVQKVGDIAKKFVQ